MDIDTEFNFDYLANLYQTDKEEFERVTKRMISDNIERISDGDSEKRQRLEAKQWRFEQDLRKFKDPIARYNRVVELFHEQLYTFINTIRK